jgi:hypothetical protein
MKQELDACFDWVQFGHLEDIPEAKDLAGVWAREDKAGPVLSQRPPLIRDLVIDSTNLDLVNSMQLGAAIGLDSTSTEIVRARVNRGIASPVLGYQAAEILFPDVRRLRWSDIADLRRHRDVQYLRDVLRAIEARAAESAESFEELTKDIYENYGEELRRANQQLQGKFTTRMIPTAVGGIVGAIISVTTTTPFLGDMIGSALSTGTETFLGNLKRPRWLAADEAVRAKIRANQRRETTSVSSP